MGVFLMDENILEICGQNCKSLVVVELINCHFLTGKSVAEIGKCRNLRSFSLTRNKYTGGYAVWWRTSTSTRLLRVAACSHR